MKKLFDSITPLLEKISGNLYLQAVSQGMMSTLPLLMIGSISVLLLVFPLAAVKDFIAASGLSGLLMVANKYTIGFMAVYVSFFIARSAVQLQNQQDDGVRCGILSIFCFFMLTPVTVMESDMYISFEWLGASGVFTAMFTALIVAKLYLLLMKREVTLKLPQSMPPMITQVFAGILPFILISVMFMALKMLIAFTPFLHVHQLVYTLIQTPLKNLGGNIWSMVLIATLAQLLWFFGIHGTNVTNPLIMPILMAMDAENLSAAAAGTPLPNTIGYAFFVTYTVSATAIGFAVMMLFAKSSQYRAIGRIAAPAAVFGISEPLVFGTPMVLNFHFLIPFMFTNGIVLLMAYGLTSIHLIPPCIGALPIFGLPIGLHAMIQGSWKIVVMQLLTQVIGALIYLPFFRRADRQAYELEQQLEEGAVI